MEKINVKREIENIDILEKKFLYKFFIIIINKEYIKILIPNPSNDNMSIKNPDNSDQKRAVISLLMNIKKKIKGSIIFI